jgi:hypothetical protein
MTLRPFKLIYAGKTYDRKNDIFGVENHRGERLDDHSNTNKGLGIKVTKKFWKKLLSYPITAFGYRIQFEGEQQFKDLPNPKFDKKDVIKALDFWIEYFVYQNKCDYILENTVNKDFELYLEELIRVREAVLKDPADTKYVRQKIRPDSGSSFEREYNLTYVGKDGKRIKHYPKQIIEFTENVLDTSNTPFSTVDQFCYKVKTMTRKEYEDTIKKIPEQSQKAANSMSRIISGMIEANRMFISEENFRDQRSRFEFGGLGSIIRPDEGGRRTVPADGTNPMNWVVADSTTTPGRFRIINTDGVNIAGGFTSRVSAELYLRNVREQFLPSEIGPVPEGTAAFEIRGPDHLLHSNLHPGMPTEEPQAIGIMFEEGMISNLIGFAGERLGIGDRIYMNRRDGRFYKTPFGRAIEASAISYRVSEIGEMVEAVREATFIYPPGTTPTLYVDDSHLGFDADENVIIRRRLTMN